MIYWPYLTILLIYFIVILTIGKKTCSRIESIADYAIAGGKLTKWAAVSTMCATFISSATIVGGAGYSSLYGWSFPFLYGTGTIIGLMTMFIAAKKLRESGAYSLGDFIFKMYGSKFLQAWVGFVVVSVYALNLIIQLFAIGYIIEGLVGIPMFWGILLVGLVFVTYTVMGGLVSVTITDSIQFVLMTVGIICTIAVLGTKLWADPTVSLASNPGLNTIFSGQLYSWGAIITFGIVFGAGIGAHPYYLQRCFAAQDVKTARLMIASSCLYGVLFFIAMTMIGVAGVLLYPEQAGDGIFPFLAKNALGLFLGGLVSIALIAGIQSTTDSLLQVVGTSSAVDIYATFKKGLTDRELLRIAKYMTAVFGVIITLIASFMSLNPIPLIVLLTAFTWGVMGSSLFILIYGTIFWKRATVLGAIGSSIGGFSGAIIGRLLFNAGILPFNEIYLSVGLSVILLITLSLASKRGSNHAKT